MYKLILVMLIYCIGCAPENLPRANKITYLLEQGTDSTYNREYFPNPNKSLYAVLTKYYNAEINTFFYYYDIDKKSVSEIKTYMINNLYGHYFEFYRNET